jgi:hypothetical protein
MGHYYTRIGIIIVDKMDILEKEQKVMKKALGTIMEEDPPTIFRKVLAKNKKRKRTA